MLSAVRPLSSLLLPCLFSLVSLLFYLVSLLFGLSFAPLLSLDCLSRSISSLLSRLLSPCVSMCLCVLIVIIAPGCQHNVEAVTLALCRCQVKWGLPFSAKTAKNSSACSRQHSAAVNLVPLHGEIQRRYTAAVERIKLQIARVHDKHREKVRLGGWGWGIERDAIESERWIDQSRERIYRGRY